MSNKPTYLAHRQHKYIKKIGTRYFYTTEELKAFYDQAKSKASDKFKDPYGKSAEKYDRTAEINKGEVTRARAKADAAERAETRALMKSNSDPKSYELARAKRRKATQELNNANAELYSNQVKAADIRKKSLLGKETTQDRINRITGSREKYGDTTRSSGSYSKKGTISSEDDRLVRYNTEDRYTKVDVNRAAESAKREAERQKAREAERRKTSVGNSTFLGGPDRTSDAYRVKRVEESKKKGVAVDTARDNAINNAKEAVNNSNKKKKRSRNLTK